MADLTGRTLGQYRIIEQLGRGGMAEVYKAYQPALDRYVAVKVLHPMVAADEQFLARFQREAKAVAALRHPNIVQIHDFGHEADHYYMVMEFVEGQTLKHRLDSLQRAGTRMPLDEVTRIVAEVGSALAYAHQRGMIHRDVKPANVLLSAEGQAVLSDFGIAYMVEGTRYTLTGVIGTPDYMSPEQGMGRPVDARSDIYSLGVMLYEMLTGRVPFSADTPMAVIFKHVQNPLPMPRSINPAISEAVERVVLKAMAKNPDDRFATAGQMAEALQAAIAAGAPAVEITPPSEPVFTAVLGPQPVPTGAVLPPPPTARVAARPVLSRSLIAGGALALMGIGAVALLVAGGILWFLLRGREQGVTPVPVVASLTPELAPATPVGLRPRPNGPPVFEDDFSDGAKGARPLFAGRMAFDYADGRGRLTSQTVGAVMPAMYSAPKLADFYAEFDVEASAAAPSDYGFIFRSDDAEGGLAWYYLLGVHPAQGTAGLMCWRDPEWVVDQEFTLPPGLLKPTGANHVRLEAVGGEFRIFVNDTFAFAAADSTLVDAGIFGFYIVPAKQGDFVYFDNLRVYGLGEAIRPAHPTPTAASLPATDASTPSAPSLTPTLSLAQREAALLDRIDYRRENGPAIFAPRFDTPPQVDGRLDDWPDYAFDIAQTVFRPENLSGPADLSAAGFVGWDENYLYLGVRVTDDVLVQTQTGSQMYKGDSIEIQFDHDLAGDLNDQTLSSDDHQLGLSPGDFAGRTPEAYIWLPKSQEQPGTMIDVAARRTSDGYALESAIPWHVLGGRPSLETPLGFCLNVNDNDTPATAEQNVMISSCRNRKWGDPTTFGPLILVDWR